MTLRFALDHKGNLKGKPVASYSKLPGTIAEQKEFVAAALTSLDKCLPLPVTSRFGPIISSRPLLIRFSGPKPRDRASDTLLKRKRPAQGRPERQEGRGEAEISRVRKKAVRQTTSMVFRKVSTSSFSSGFPSSASGRSPALPRTPIRC